MYVAVPEGVPAKAAGQNDSCSDKTPLTMSPTVVISACRQ